MRALDPEEVLARVDDGDRSVRIERRRFIARDGKPRRLIAVAVYERLHFGGWACRRVVTLRVRELAQVINGLALARCSDG